MSERRVVALTRSIDRLKTTIANACERSGRTPEGVTVIAVTKTHPADVVRDAYAAGLRNFGENRVQEGVGKIAELRSVCPGATWHLIGHLQTNKAKVALDAFDILHGVDSQRLARAIDAAASRRVRVLIEVNVAGERTKFGVNPAEVAAAVRGISDLPNVEVVGLMTVAPQVDDPEDVRWVFRRLRELRDGLGLAELSMGMTDDYAVAVEEGSTLVRVGRAIFGERALQGTR